MNNEFSLINTARKFCYHFLKSFLAKEPDDILFASWKEIVSSLEPVEFSPFDEALLDFKKVLEVTPLSKIQEEFYRLFLDPFSEENIPLEASFYLDGKPFGPSLAKLRSFLKEVGLEREPTVKEPEDHLVLLLDFMERLIEEEKDLPFQRELFYNFLKPTLLGVAARIKKSETSFYQSVIKWMEAFLLMEEKFWEESF